MNPARPSVRGFGFLHDGTVGNLQHFFLGNVFAEVPLNGSFTADRTSLGALGDAQLRALVGTRSDALTFTAVPPGSGWRIVVDRNGDCVTDGSN